MPAPSSPDSLPPALLALGYFIATGGEEWRTTEFDSAELVQAAVDAVALDVVNREEVIHKLERNSGEYLELARTWLRARSRHPWQARLSRQRQAWLTDAERNVPPEHGFVPARGYFGNGVWRPRHGGLETTTRIQGWPSQWRISYSWPPRAQLRLWTLEVRAGARILEIDQANDWRQLTELYPLLVETMPLSVQPDVALPAPLYLPDWSEVASDWDGVRLTMQGVLGSVFAVLTVLDGYTVFYDQIGDERTLWLNWVLEPVGKPTLLPSFD